jgi:hypothetical protein
LGVPDAVAVVATCRGLRGWDRDVIGPRRLSTTRAKHTQIDHERAGETPPSPPPASS